MENEILDYFGEFDADSRIVAVKYFFQESEARMYAARLTEAGIRNFISNANTVTALPLGHRGIGLHVRDADLREAASVVARLDHQLRRAASDQSFHDADHDEIQFQKELHRRESRQADRIILFILVLIFLIILRAFLRASGLAPYWLDFF